MFELDLVAGSLAGLLAPAYFRDDSGAKVVVALPQGRSPLVFESLGSGASVAISSDRGH